MSAATDLPPHRETSPLPAAQPTPAVLPEPPCAMAHTPAPVATNTNPTTQYGRKISISAIYVD